MPDPVHIGLIGRTCHTSNSGIEILRKFHIQPYESHPDFIKTLQGYIDGNRKRQTPCRDPYIPVCYCTECEINFSHADATSSTQSIDGIDGTLKEKLEGGKVDAPKQKETTEGGTAGAIVTAHYRPLITAWKSKDENKPDDDVFDWLDPIMIPGTRQIPWPSGLHTNATRPILWDKISVPDDIASPLSVGVDDVFVRRILLPRLPRHTIQQCEGCVNFDTFPAANHPAGSDGSPFPRCRPRTLRFIGAESSNMMDTAGNRWFEVKYHFQRVSHWTNRLIDADGKIGEGWVTWNHVFMRPLGALLGWYPVWQNAQRQPTVMGALVDMLPGLQLTAGRLMNEADFSLLFEL